MGDKLILSAALKKGDSGDTLIFADGTQIPLPTGLTQPNGTPMVVEVMTAEVHRAGQHELAKHILQDILNGRPTAPS